MTSKELHGELLKPARLRMVEKLEGLQVGILFGQRILIKPIEPFTEIDRLEKEGILYAPERHKDSIKPGSSTGIVLRCGEFSNLALRPGDAVLFNKYGLIGLMIGGEQLGIVEDCDVYCVLVDAAESIGD